MPSERGNSLLHTLLYQPQCQSSTVFQHLLSDLHLEGAQQQPKAINWWGGCWSCCHPCYGVMWPSRPWHYFQSHSLPTGLPRATKDHSTLLRPFSNWVIYFWSSSSWKKIPKMVGHFMLWKSTVFQGPQTSFSQIITELEKTQEVYIPPQATFTVLYCLLKLRVLHGNTSEH